jgi:ribA/ribD-fused uncharacterized protein
MVNSFKGEYRFLSNFYPCEIEYDGLYYPSVENAYQAAKTINTRIRLEISNMSAAEVKKAGRKVQLDPEFEINKFLIMETLLRMKFKYYPLLDWLRDTKGELIEGNTWHDNIWGMCSCEKCVDKEKHNHLGRLLMKIRDELQKLLKD